MLQAHPSPLNTPLPAGNLIRTICQRIYKALADADFVIGLAPPLHLRVQASLPNAVLLRKIERRLPDEAVQALHQNGTWVTGQGLGKAQPDCHWLAAALPLDGFPAGLFLATSRLPFPAGAIESLTSETLPILATCVENVLLKAGRFSAHPNFGLLGATPAARKLSQRLSEMTILADLAQKTSATLNVEEVLQTTVHEIHEQLDTYAVSIMLLDAGGGLALVACAGLPEEVRRQAYLPPGEGIGGEVVRSGQPIYLPEASLDPRFKEVDPELRSLLVAPLIVKGRVIGTLSIDSRQRHAFSPSIERFLNVAASQTAIAIENARLYGAEHRRVDELNTLMELVRSISQHLELDQMYIAAHRAIARLMQSEAFYISLRDFQVEESVATYLIDKGTRYPAAHWPLDMGLAGYVIRTGQRVLIRDLNAEGLPVQPVFYGDKEHVRSLLAVPLRFGGEVIGAVSTQSYQPQAFDEHDLALLEGIADHIAIAVVNAKLYANLEKRYLSLQELDRVRMEFTQNVSHELRTPLTFLRAYVDLLLEGGLGALNERQQQSLKIVQAKTATLVRLVEDITTLESSDQEWLVLQETDLKEIARQAVLLAEKTTAQEEISITFTAPEVFPAVQADAGRISQVFEQLIGNALKFGGHDSPIEVCLQARPEYALISVTNHGTTIPRQEQERIFERFYQVDGSITRRHGGMGLGLAIVKHIIQAHGGQVWVESKEGDGTRFSFSLPYKQRVNGRKGPSEPGTSNP